ncbi:hypothetical protein SPAB_05403 [Salmonella enterica subsp. enterica serovar Paratyphi B str. SPB7]|uniref:Uncharacterized protein n=1 Tax=Salmonella paratyphi B (strain ATCC BAA-1250 / SPB7) TaxID=1016998 RepID=A0A6C6ZAI6_SALPB|nr:hypothetical protein SPAB_05403 [Salmonella enterica subsp. enterica serovar Paratyphi B str. SPB7]
MRPLRPVWKKPEKNFRFALLLFQVQPARNYAFHAIIHFSQQSGIFCDHPAIILFSSPQIRKPIKPEVIQLPDSFSSVRI